MKKYLISKKVFTLSTRGEVEFYFLDFIKNNRDLRLKNTDIFEIKMLDRESRAVIYCQIIYNKDFEYLGFSGLVSSEDIVIN